MAKKEDLRLQRLGTVINQTSSRQEKALVLALANVSRMLEEKFPGIRLKLETQWFLSTVVSNLRERFPEAEFHYYHERSSMRPDGGILSILDTEDKAYPILIAEKKNQGTNNLRAAEGKTKQAKGNAIERLGKNVIGFRTALMGESIFPFVCFGDGCDFEDGSTILDRVTTIAMFGKLNHEHLHNTGLKGIFDRGTFYFREKEWDEAEMTDKCYSIAEKSVFYYYSKHGEDSFVNPKNPQANHQSKLL
ncbi:hypothetical protein GCM10010840_36430 [Deinococcus aerolatus]|uniref:Restriction endonuclease n=1 Tax=Deinococcus aerolatus TaxID=522487 RepID=A0ABQ2GGT0_9DEIO|nr:EcoRI family type II restriction endonuclease [Deinococcus aerolatus]GGL95077.1 hypothetical protein GCM10010840_36430 [Deinococcus aerolatus]